MSYSPDLRRLSCLACLLFLSACASAEAVHEMSAGKKLAVASAVGNDLNLQWIGTTVFNNEEGKHSGFNIDQMVLDAATSTLQNTGRYASVAAIPSGEDNECPQTPAGYDLLICFEPWTISNDYFPRFRGVGLMRRTLFGSHGSTIGIVSMSTEILDQNSSRVRGNAQWVTWSPGFQLEEGPKIPDKDLAGFEPSLRNRVQENVTKILKAVGLLTEVEPNELARTLGLMK